MRRIALALILCAWCASSWPAATLASDAQTRAELLRNARFWEHRQRDDLAAAALEKLLKVSPDDAEAVLALGLIRLRENKLPETQQWVQRLQRVRPNSREAQQLADAYRIQTRDRLPWATARRLAQSGRTDEAIAVLQKLFPKGAPPDALGLEYYRIIGRRMDGRAQALSGLRQLAEQHPEYPRYRETLKELLAHHASTMPSQMTRGTRLPSRASESPATHEVAAALRADGERALAQGHHSAALKQLSAALDMTPEDPWLRLALAKLYLQLGLPDEARDLMQKGVRSQPRDDDTRYAQALLLMSVDREDEALQAIAAVPVARRTDGMRGLQRRAQVAQVRRLLATGQTGAARTQVQTLLQAAPQDVELWVQAGRVELADHHYERAREYFERARSLDQARPTADLASVPTAAAAELDALNRRREGFIAAGPQMRSKPGDPGISDLRSLEVPVELVVPWGYEGHVLAHADTVRIDAGTLPAVYNDAAFYGKVQALGPASLARFPNGAPQQATGVALGLGYENDDWRFDLGTTPIGFPVLDVVGGIKYSGKLAGFDYSADLARRPLTSSLLAYAGAHDPATGAVWGGVRSNGLSVWAGRDFFERLGLSFSGGAQLLQGRNVPVNTYLSFRTAVDWQFVDAPNTQLFAGAALSYWHYSQNLSGYTFGQGGYYSPQSYVALSLPLDWRGRLGDFSYRLRPAVSYSVSRTDDSPFYPGDAALQQQAMGSPLPPGYTRPVHDGGSGAGIGYSLKVALEYHLLPDYFVGVSYDMDRSEYYAPNVGMVYLRHTFDDWTRPVPVPPRPPKAYSDF